MRRMPLQGHASAREGRCVKRVGTLRRLWLAWGQWRTQVVQAERACMSEVNRRVQQVFLCKSIEALRAVADSGGEGGLQRSLGVTRLAMIGISSTIGTGIFFIFGVATPLAGPGVVLAFVVAGLAAALSALCYAELVSALPTAGSAYSAAYASLGEGVAFLVAACLLLEYGVATSAIAVTWGQYVNQLGEYVIGWSLPHVLSAPPSQGGIINLPAVALISMASLLLLRGARQSATANAVMVFIKIAVLLIFIVIGATAFNADNFAPFLPNGVAGVGAAASVIFFAYIGIDSIATAGEEAVNPRRTLPLATLIAFVVVTSLYVTVAIVAVGAQPMAAFAGQDAGLAVILEKVTQARWPSILLTAGAIISIFSVALVLMFGQTRVLYAVSRDGLLPSMFSRVDASSGAPALNTVTVAIVSALISGFCPLGVLAEMCSVGALAAFILVALSVIALRVRQPDMPREFRLPLYPFTPLVSIALCLYLLAGLAPVTLVLFAGWVSLSALVYFGYSMRHSQLAAQQPSPTECRPAPQ